MTLCDVLTQKSKCEPCCKFVIYKNGGHLGLDYIFIYILYSENLIIEIVIESLSTNKYNLYQYAIMCHLFSQNHKS